MLKKMWEYIGFKRFIQKGSLGEQTTLIALHSTRPLWSSLNYEQAHVWLYGTLTIVGC